MKVANNRYRNSMIAGKLLKLAATFFLGIQMLSAMGQTFQLPDSNFRKKLISSYPWVMSGNALNIAAAQTMTGTLDVSSSNISDLTGIEYFKSINTLNANYNKLVTVPGVAGLSNLVYLDLNYNQLTSVPSISALTNLAEFQVAYNQLTSLPSFENNPGLKVIFCANNKLTSLPDISFLTGLVKLIIGSNPYKSLPDFSPFVNLSELHVHDTGIDTIKGLSSLSNLRVLYAWGNRIRDLSGVNANTKINTFVIYDNELASLPVLTNKPLMYVVLNTNRLTFEDLLPLTSMSNFSSFDYFPQKTVDAPETIVAREKDNITLVPKIDAGVTSNWYKWYRNGVYVDSNQTGELPISPVSYADSGNYVVKVTNPNVKGLTLICYPKKVMVKPCLEIVNNNLSLTQAACAEGSVLDFQSLQLGGGTAPFTYSLVFPDHTDSVSSTSPVFTHIKPGSYFIWVSDGNMCKAVSPVVVPRPKDCDAIFSPDNDGVMDNFFITDQGKARIYNIKRDLIKELQAPASWDGTRNDGSEAEAGYYSIVVNGKKIIHVTLIR